MVSLRFPDLIPKEHNGGDREGVKFRHKNKLRPKLTRMRRAFAHVWGVLTVALFIMMCAPTLAQDGTAVDDAPLRIAWEHERYYTTPNTPLNLTAQLTNTLPAAARNAVENIFVEVSLPQGVELAYQGPFTERVLIGNLRAGESLPLSWPLIISPEANDGIELTIDVEAGELFARSSTILISRPRSPSLAYYEGGTFTFVDGLGNGEIIGTARTGINGRPIIGDWNGDGYDGYGLYASGLFYLYDDVPQADVTNPEADLIFPIYDAPRNGIPLAGDWDGDGIDSVMVYEAGVFFLRNFPTAGDADRSFFYGDLSANAQPLAGDWNGDGLDSVGIYRDGVFSLRNSNTDGEAEVVFQYGDVAGATPLIGDWNGDLTDSVGILRNGTLLLRDTANAGNADVAFPVPPRYQLARPLVGYWVGTND